MDLSGFHVLVGPNGSGKSTFLDAIEFVKSCLVEGPRRAVELRVPDFRDLTFMRRGGEIAIDLWLDLSALLPEREGRLHYRLAIVADDQLGVRVSEETLERAGKPKSVKLVGKTATGKDFYRRELGTYQDVFVFGADKLALSLTPPDETRYPSGNAAKSFLTGGIRYIQLDSPAMREPAPATRPTELQVDGANLARAVGQITRSRRDVKSNTIENWTSHLRYALEDLKSIGWAARAADNAE